ncbi:MAG: orotate phosphoribosyltransferase [SAR324 cluster bacterium]|uniref:Orotate phosphoribosyltransferase n=1 Tax=SAR324 cluster bacterium TaxID=2024889 RepID=A0A2A4TB10_9DELT|nr:MAG: orotate phosphoribosyltransferase [SAR324 cluster bacterium]
MKQKIIDSLIDIGAVKFGEFTLKSGIISPIYIDLRIIISYPKLLEQIAAAMQELSQELSFQEVAGIPYTALPIATAFSLASQVPMIYSRKEKKNYGTSQQIEGVWQSGDQVLIIDDLITNGDSKLETFQVFENVGLTIRDVVVLIDREQGGKNRLQKAGYCLHSLISVFEILERMKELKKLDDTQYEEVKAFLMAPVS